MTHENFWRQLLRWLVDGVPGAVEVHTSTDRVEAGEPVTLTADVVDDTFVELNDAQVVGEGHGAVGRGRSTCRCSGPASATASTAARSSRPSRACTRARVEATREGKRSAPVVTHVRAAPGDAEYFDATMHAALLKRIAEETGGRFYTPETMSDAARGPEVHRPRRDDGRRARAVAHADRAARARGADLRRMGLLARRRDGVEVASAKGSMCRSAKAEVQRSWRSCSWRSLCCCAAVAAAGVCAGRRTCGRRRARGRAGARRAVSTLGGDAGRRAGEARRRERRSTLPRSRTSMPSASPANRRRKDRQGVRRSCRPRGEDDMVFIVLFGHGTFDGKVAKFNLPGPDMTPADFAPLLKKLKSRHVVFVNTASASGPFVRRWRARGGRSSRRRAPAPSGSRRCSAATSSTRSPAMRRGLRQEPPHLGARGVRLRKREVATAYEREGHHADRARAARRQRRRGHPESAPDGRRASRGGARARQRRGRRSLPADPKLRALYVERRDLERRIEALKLLKGSMPAGAVRRRAREAGDRPGAEDAEIREAEKK